MKRSPLADLSVMKGSISVPNLVPLTDVVIRPAPALTIRAMLRSAWRRVTEVTLIRILVLASSCVAILFGPLVNYFFLGLKWAVLRQPILSNNYFAALGTCVGFSLYRGPEDDNLLRLVLSISGGWLGYMQVAHIGQLLTDQDDKLCFQYSRMFCLAFRVHWYLACAFGPPFCLAVVHTLCRLHGRALQRRAWLVMRVCFYFVACNNLITGLVFEFIDDWRAWKHSFLWQEWQEDKHWPSPSNGDVWPVLFANGKLVSTCWLLALPLFSDHPRSHLSLPPVVAATAAPPGKKLALVGMY